MDGLNHLKFRKSEPEVFAAINERFGSFEQLYMKLFELNYKVYQLTKQIPDEYEYWRTEFHERIYQELEPEKDAEFLALMNEFQIIQNKLEQCEIMGAEPIADIGRDFDNIMVRKKKKDFLNWMNRNGSDFPNLIEWIDNLKKQ
ncbi:hypothetical protein [Flavobacterium sp.]|uniref:hypothetical protein n=1 Tax=Flavobacterium sp. TaxID=239 RepID=UPI0039E3A328